MTDPNFGRLRIINFILAFAVILGCSDVMANNQGNWSILLSGLTTMVLWTTLCYMTWLGIGIRSNPHRIKRAQILNIGITLLFTLLILTIVVSTKSSPIPIILPLGMLIIPLFLNLRALKKRQTLLALSDLAPSVDNASLSIHPFNSSNTGTPLSPSRIEQYFIRHWRGNCSLPVSFWINGGIIAGMGTALLSSLLSRINYGDYSLRLLSSINLGALLFLALVWTWACVGIWRSAEHHALQGGSIQWRNMAQCSVIVGILIMSGPFSHSFLPQLKECALIASGQDPLGNIHITVSANKNSVIVNGKLREGAAREIQSLIDTTPTITSLVLNSSGGRVLEAKKLAQTVRARKLNTYVEGQCISACTYPFLAGQNRAASPNAQIGFHPPSFPGIDDHTQRSITEDMLTVYRTAGLPEEFIQTIGKVSPEDMWYPSREKLLESHVINRVSSAGKTVKNMTLAKSKQEF